MCPSKKLTKQPQLLKLDKNEILHITDKNKTSWLISLFLTFLKVNCKQIIILRKDECISLQSHYRHHLPRTWLWVEISDSNLKKGLQQNINLFFCFFVFYPPVLPQSHRGWEFITAWFAEKAGRHIVSRSITAPTERDALILITQFNVSGPGGFSQTLNWCKSIIYAEESIHAQYLMCLMTAWRHVLSKNISSFINLRWGCMAHRKERRQTFPSPCANAVEERHELQRRKNVVWFPSPAAGTARWIQKDRAIDFLLLSQALGKPWWPPSPRFTKERTIPRGEQ